MKKLGLILIMLFMFVGCDTATTTTTENTRYIELEQRIVDLEQEVSDISTVYITKEQLEYDVLYLSSKLDENALLQSYVAMAYDYALTEFFKVYEMSQLNFNAFTQSDILFYATNLGSVNLKIKEFNDLSEPSNDQIEKYQLLLFSRTAYENIIYNEIRHLVD